MLQNADGPLALKDLSAQSDLDPSGAHRYLASFVRCGLVRQEADSRYDFGPLALQIGLAAMRRIEPVQLAEQALPELVAETGYTALLAVWSNRGPTVVRWQRSREPLVTNLGLGSVLPISRSAAGTVLVAFLPQAVTAEALAAEARRESIDREAFERAVERAQDPPGLRRQHGDPGPPPRRARSCTGTATRSPRSPSFPRTASSRASHPAAVTLRNLCDRLSKDFGANLKAAA